MGTVRTHKTHTHRLTQELVKVCVREFETHGQTVSALAYVRREAFSERDALISSH